MKKNLKVFTALLLVMMLIFSTVSVYADNKEDLKDVQNEIEEKEDELKAGRKEEKRLEKEIENLEVKISESENELVEINEDIEKTEKKIEKTSIDLEKAEDKVAVQNENLNSRLRAMYKNGSVGFVDVLLSSGSISEFIMNYEMVKQIYASDKEVLSKLQENYDIIDEKKSELEYLQGNMVDQKQEQLALQDELKADKKAVKQKKNEVAENNENLEDNIADLEEEAEEIEAIIKADAEAAAKAAAEAAANESSSNGTGSSGSSSETYSDGQFSWPVPGWTRVSSDYGPRICPFHGPEVHSGIDIPASYGTPVIAAAAGTVISAGYQGSYGNAVIISHGGGLYTLYAHNSSLVVSVGQTVEKGQQVSRIGSTGSSTGNHLHFEVRSSANYGTHVSPWTYLK